MKLGVCSVCGKDIAPLDARVNYCDQALTLFCEDCWVPGLGDILEDGTLDDLPTADQVASQFDKYAVLCIRAHRGLVELRQFKIDTDHFNEYNNPGEPMEYGFDVDAVISAHEELCVQLELKHPGVPVAAPENCG